MSWSKVFPDDEMTKEIATHLFAIIRPLVCFVSWSDVFPDDEMTKRIANVESGD